MVKSKCIIEGCNKLQRRGIGKNCCAKHLPSVYKIKCCICGKRKAQALHRKCYICKQISKNVTKNVAAHINDESDNFGNIAHLNYCESVGTDEDFIHALSILLNTPDILFNDHFNFQKSFL